LAYKLNTLRFLTQLNRLNISFLVLSSLQIERKLAIHCVVLFRTLLLLIRLGKFVACSWEIDALGK
jgi:hypothetical protein